MRASVVAALLVALLCVAQRASVVLGSARRDVAATSADGSGESTPGKLEQQAGKMSTEWHADIAAAAAEIAGRTAATGAPPVSVSPPLRVPGGDVIFAVLVGAGDGQHPASDARNVRGSGSSEASAVDDDNDDSGRGYARGSGGWGKTQNSPGEVVLLRVRGGDSGGAIIVDGAYAAQPGEVSGVSAPQVAGAALNRSAHSSGRSGADECVCVLTSTSQAVCTTLLATPSTRRGASAPWVSPPAVSNARTIHVARPFNDAGSVHVFAPAAAKSASAPKMSPDGVLIGALDTVVDTQRKRVVPRLVGIGLVCPARELGASGAHDGTQVRGVWDSGLNVTYTGQDPRGVAMTPYVAVEPAIVRCPAGTLAVTPALSWFSLGDSNQLQFTAHDVTSGRVVWQFPSRHAYPEFAAASVSPPIVLPASVLQAISPPSAHLNWTNDAVCTVADTPICVDACTGEQVSDADDLRYFDPSGPSSIGEVAVIPITGADESLKAALRQMCTLLPSTLAYLPTLTAGGGVRPLVLCVDVSGGAEHSMVRFVPVFNAVALGTTMWLAHDGGTSRVWDMAPPRPVILQPPSMAPTPVMCYPQRVMPTVDDDDDAPSVTRVSESVYSPLSPQTGVYVACAKLAVDMDGGVFQYVAAVRYALVSQDIDEAFLAPPLDTTSASRLVAVTATTGEAVEVDFDGPAEVCSAGEVDTVSLFDHPLRSICSACRSSLPGIDGTSARDSHPWVVSGILTSSPALKLTIDTVSQMPTRIGAMCVSRSDNTSGAVLGDSCWMRTGPAWYGNISSADLYDYNAENYGFGNLLCINSANGNGVQWEEDSGASSGSGSFDGWVGPVQTVPSFRAWAGFRLAQQGFAVDCDAYEVDSSARMRLYVGLSVTSLVVTFVATVSLVVIRRRNAFIGVISPLRFGTKCADTAALVQSRPRKPCFCLFRCRKCRNRSSTAASALPPVAAAASRLATWRLTVYCGMTWICGVLLSLAARAWSGLPAFDAFAAMQDDCAWQTLAQGVDFLEAPLINLTLTVQVVVGTAWVLEFLPQFDVSLRVLGVLSSGPLIFVACWTNRLLASAFNGLGPGLALVCAGGPAIYWSTLAFTEVLAAPAEHPWARRGNPWFSMWLGHSTGVVVLRLVGVLCVVLGATPFGNWAAFDQGPMWLAFAVLLMNMLLTIESRSVIVNALDTWYRLGAQVAVPHHAGHDTDGRDTLAEVGDGGLPDDGSPVVKQPAVMLRVHALAALLPISTFAHIAAFVTVPAVVIPRAVASMHSTDEEDEPWALSRLSALSLHPTALYSLYLVILFFSALHQLLLQFSVKHSGENALFALRSHEMRLPPLLPRSVSAASDPLKAFAEWATSWSGQQILALTSHATSVASILFKIGGNDVLDRHGEECLQQLIGITSAELAAFGLCVSSIGLLVSLHTVASRHFFRRIARALPVDDSFRMTATLKMTALGFKCGLLCLHDRNEPRGTSFYFLLFASIISVAVLLTVMWVQARDLAKAARESRVAAAARGHSDARDDVLAGVTALAQQDSDLFQGVAHPRLLIAMFYIGYAASAVLAALLVAASGWGDFSFEWILALYGLLLVNKMWNNELANFLRSRQNIVNERRQAHPAPRDSDDAEVAQPLLSSRTVSSQARSLHGIVVVGSSQSVEGVRSLTALTLLAICGYLAIVGIGTEEILQGSGSGSGSATSGSGAGSVECGISGFFGSVLSPFDLACQVVGVLGTVVLASRVVLVLVALDGMAGVALGRRGKGKSGRRCCGKTFTAEVSPASPAIAEGVDEAKSDE